LRAGGRLSSGIAHDASRCSGRAPSRSSRAVYVARAGCRSARARLRHGAGKDQRYFGIRGVGEQVNRAFSRRTDEVHRAAQRFRAEHGRDPERGERRSLALPTREAKLLRARAELDDAWRATAADHGLEAAPLGERVGPRPEVWAERVVEHATRRGAVFDERELRSVALEQAAGTGIAPERALAGLEDLRDQGRVVELADGTFTTARMRAPGGPARARLRCPRAR